MVAIATSRSVSISFIVPPLCYFVKKNANPAKQAIAPIVLAPLRAIARNNKKKAMVFNATPLIGRKTIPTVLR